LPPLDTIEGSIDDLNRPLVRIELPGFSDSLIAFIDTGFNGAVILDEAQATTMGFKVSASWHAGVTLASQREETFLLGRGMFQWFGERKEITAYILVETQAERRARIAHKTEEEILIGTELLSACRVELDFPARKVLIVKVE
jgi:predicted aspartyl protease